MVVPRDTWPRLLGRRAAQLEDAEDRADLRLTAEKHVSGDHLRHAASGRPIVHLGPVDGRAEEDLRRPVPKGHHVVGVLPERRRGEPGEPEVADLDPVGANQDVVRLQVAVDDQAHVARLDAGKQLLGILLHLLHRHPLSLAAETFQDPGEVHVHILEDEKAIPFRDVDIPEPHDVGVLEILEQRDLAQQVRWDARVARVVELLPFHCNQVVGLPVARLEDDPEVAGPDAVQAFVAPLQLLDATEDIAIIGDAAQGVVVGPLERRRQKRLLPRLRPCCDRKSRH
mmetsp:Transcript_53722/g.154971  ORF Transcript_53722/g.154971 Transcript_53722/m.154971 type:complete len:284 (-) Transcript_53722:75-926(-)